MILSDGERDDGDKEWKKYWAVIVHSQWSDTKWYLVLNLTLVEIIRLENMVKGDFSVEAYGIGGFNISSDDNWFGKTLHSFDDMVAHMNNVLEDG